MSNKVIPLFEKDDVKNLVDFMNSKTFKPTMTISIPENKKYPRQFHSPLNFLQLACFYGSEQIYAYLCQVGFRHDGKKPSLLNCAAAGGNPNIFNSVAMVDGDFSEAGFIAIAFNHNDLYTNLIRPRFPDPNVLSSENKNYIHYAAEYDNGQAITYFCQQGVNANIHDNYDLAPIHYACMKNNLNALTALLYNPYCDVNASNKDKGTALQMCIKDNLKDCINLLLRRADIKLNTCDKTGKTPLAMAVDLQNQELVNLFAQRQEVSADLANTNGDTPLMLAAKEKNGQIFNTILHMPTTNVNRYNADLNTVVHFAVQNKNTEFLETLVKLPQIDLDFQNRKGSTPLLLAAEKNMTHHFKILLNTKRVNINAKNDAANTSLHYAVKNKNNELISLLIAQPEINVNIQNDEGETPLHMAVKMNEIGAVKALLSNPKSDVDAKNKLGQTPFLLSGTNPEIFSLILQCGRVNINAIDIKWNTIYHFASNTPKVLQQMTATVLPVDPTTRNVEGKTALEKATNKECQALLATITDNFFKTYQPPQPVFLQ